MGIGEQFAQLGQQIGEYAQIGPKADLEVAKLRREQSEKQAKISPNEILEGLAAKAYHAKDKDERAQAMNAFNEASELLGPMIERMQRIKADWQKTYGEDLPMDEPKIAQAPLPADFFDDPPESPAATVTGNMMEALSTSSIAALRNAKDPKKQASVDTRYSEKETQLRKHFLERDPDAGPVEVNDFVSQGMAALKKRDSLFWEDPEEAKKFKAPDKVDYVQTYGYEKFGKTMRKVRKTTGGGGEKKTKSKMSSEDKQAYDWAKQNAKDPKAKKVVQKLKDEGKI